ncbi:MAG TPA: hypothetical protein VFX59_20895, partial [Polyangiales bacterium]|nr:hypothetical protein [Polyangiales bacterium]
MSPIRADLTAIAATLAQIDKWLTKAEAAAATKSYDPLNLLSARLDERVELGMRIRLVGLLAEGHGAEGQGRDGASAAAEGSVVH